MKHGTEENQPSIFFKEFGCRAFCLNRNQNKGTFDDYIKKEYL